MNAVDEDGDVENVPLYEESQLQCTSKGNVHTYTVSSTTNLYHCSKCNKGFTQRKLIHDHFRKTCRADRLFECVKCQLQFNTKLQLETHKITEGCGGLFKCSVCDAVLSSRSVLRTHMKRHSLPPKENSNECPQCDQRFYCLRLLLVHLQKHKTEQYPFFKCKICDQEFTVKLKLLEHRDVVHIKGKLYADKLLCEKCGKWLASSTTLEMHMAAHSGIKPFKCTICGKKSRTDSALRKHMNIHTGRKPYQCDVCGKNFSRKENMKTHYTVHTGELKYQCNICGKKCSRSDNLATHLKMHARKKIVASQRN